MRGRSGGGSREAGQAMVVESGGAPVEGESTRSYHDGKPHLNLLGYWVYTKQVQQGSNQKYKAASSSLIVLRHADAATGSLYSLLNNGKIDQCRLQELLFFNESLILQLLIDQTVLLHRETMRAWYGMDVRRMISYKK